MVEQPTTVSIKDKIRSARRPTRSVDLCLETELQDRFEVLEQQLAEASAATSRDKRLGSGAEVRQLAEQIEALRAEMQDYVITFKLQAVGQRRWNDLLREHPPREGNEEDQVVGHNIDTFYDAAIQACAVDPVLDDDDWRVLLGDTEERKAELVAAGKVDEVEEGKLTAKQFNDLYQAVLALNVRRISLPNSYAASRILRPSENE
ncbi:hypothetical protein AB0B94_30705 [Micromonospora sp. NPDC048986]|uniref:hypothetical protein n=1 Tax=Micromonospora sp. NPDC048986 TaxID=3155644 RepID=UPI003411EA40